MCLNPDIQSCSVFRVLCCAVLFPFISQATEIQTELMAEFICLDMRSANALYIESELLHCAGINSQTATHPFSIGRFMSV